MKNTDLSAAVRFCRAARLYMLWKIVLVLGGGPRQCPPDMGQTTVQTRPLNPEPRPFTSCKLWSRNTLNSSKADRIWCIYAFSPFMFGWIICQWVSRALISGQDFPFIFWLFAGFPHSHVWFCICSHFRFISHLKNSSLSSIVQSHND